MARTGRPPIKLDMDQLGALCRMRPTLEDCAAFFKCSVDKIQRDINKHTGLTFKEFREQHFVETRFDIVRKAIEKAKAGDNTMLIFCLKNLANWKDRHDESQTTVVTANITNQLPQVELEDRVKLIKGKE
jgi:AraC-like DNA-binding protein